MSIEKAKSGDAASSDLIAGSRSGEAATATGRFTIQCFDKDGNLKWEDENHNLVVNVGLQYVAGVALTGTAQSNTWYFGLYGAAFTNSPAASDTLAAHAGWTEITPYSGNRPSTTFTAATNANPAVVTNSASPALFNINASATVGGAFLCNVASGTTGVLFSAADFQSPGDLLVASGDILNVTYTFSLGG
jgi:hypothetical protein